ncbi:MAG: AAA family ATPase [Pseudomonadota bacterium]|nr:AAA family ATPase [Pseudomonadota bacterium]
MVTIEDLGEIAERTENLQEEILRTEFRNPDAIKQSPRFKFSEAAKYIGVSRNTFKKQFDSVDLPHTPAFDKNGKPTAPVFTVDQLVEIQQIFKDLNIKGFELSRRPDVAKKPFVLMVGNLKGGANKTTLAVHLAQHLATIGYRVLGLDADPQGSFSSMMGFFPYEYDELPEGTYFVKPENTLLSLYANKQPLRPAKTYWKNLDLITANIQGYSSEYFIPARQINDGENFWDILDYAINTTEDKWKMTDEVITEDEQGRSVDTAYHPDNYDIIIIDTPPSYSYSTMNSIYASDAILVPAPAQHLDILATGTYFDQMREYLTEVRDLEGKAKTFEFILGVAAKMTGFDESIKNAGRLAAIFREQLIPTPFYTSKAVAVAASHNKTVFELDTGQGVGLSTIKDAVANIEDIASVIETQIKNSWQRGLLDE